MTFSFRKNITNYRKWWWFFWQKFKLNKIKLADLVDCISDVQSWTSSLPRFCVYYRIALYNNRIYWISPVSVYPDTSVYLDGKMPGLVPYVMIMLLVYITVKATIHGGSRESICSTVFVTFPAGLCRKGQHNLVVFCGAGWARRFLGICFCFCHQLKNKRKLSADQCDDI